MGILRHTAFPVKSCYQMGAGKIQRRRLLLSVICMHADDIKVDTFRVA